MIARAESAVQVVGINNVPENMIIDRKKYSFLRCLVKMSDKLSISSTPSSFVLDDYNLYVENKVLTV